MASPYAVKADIVAAITLVELKRVCRYNGVDAEFDAKISAALEAANGDIDAAAKGTPGYPWTTNPPQAKTTAIDIALFKCWERSWSGVTPPLYIKEGFGRAQDSFTRLQQGDDSWGTESGDTPGQVNAQQAYVYTPNAEPAYNNPRKTLDWWLVGL